MHNSKWENKVLSTGRGQRNLHWEEGNFPLGEGVMMGADVCGWQ